MTRRRRDLTREERRLWAEVARHVAPLPGRAPAEAEPAGNTAAPHAEVAAGGRPRSTQDGCACFEAGQRPAPQHEGGGATSLGPRPRPAARPRPVAPAPPPLAPIERRTLRALSRGNLAVEATLDLHGQTQAQAHASLRRFLLRAQQNHLTLVQIVTGKGRIVSADLLAETGVLRRVVPL